MDSKVCRTCGETKVRVDFPKGKSRNDCKKCRSRWRMAYRKANLEKERAHAREYYAKNREKRKAEIRAYYIANCERLKTAAKTRREATTTQRKVDNWMDLLVGRAWSVSKRLNRVCTIDKSHIANLWGKQKGRCYWLGLPMEPSVSNRWPLAPSIDRLDCNRGYEPDNIVLCTAFANMGRRDTSVEVMNRLCHLLRQNSELIRDVNWGQAD